MEMVSITVFMTFLFLQRVSIACSIKRCISYDRFHPSACPSVRPSQSGIMSKQL